MGRHEADRRPRREIRQPEPVSIHEQGGLGKAWAQVLAADVDGKLSERTRAYARASLVGAAGGGIDDTRFAHRKYLGKKDWESVVTYFENPNPQRNRVGLLTRSADTDISLYAFLERERAPYTVNDYIEENSQPYKSSYDTDISGSDIGWPADKSWTNNVRTLSWNGAMWVSEIVSVDHSKGTILHGPNPGESGYIEQHPEDFHTESDPRIIKRDASQEELADIKRTFLVGDDIEVDGTTPPEFFYEHFRSLARQESTDVDRLLSSHNPLTAPTVLLPTSQYGIIAQHNVGKDLREVYQQHFDGAQVVSEYRPGKWSWEHFRGFKLSSDRKQKAEVVRFLEPIPVV